MFLQYCATNGCKLKLAKPSTIANFMCVPAQSSQRPKWLLNMTSVNHFKPVLKAVGKQYLVIEEVYRLLAGLTKCQTTEPMLISEDMPWKLFLELFLAWGDDTQLSIQGLCLKSIMLLALAIVLRCSNIATHLVQIIGKWIVYNVFTRNGVYFTEEGMMLYLHGIQGDYSRDGFIKSGCQ